MAKLSNGAVRRAIQSSGGRRSRRSDKAGKRSLGDSARASIQEALEAARGDAPADAAPKLAELAAMATTRGMFTTGTHLGAQAALAALKAGDQERAMTFARGAISHGAGAADKRRTSRALLPLLDQLDTVDAEAASTLRAEIRERFGLKMIPRPGEPVSPNRAQRRSLPKLCASCGAGLDADTITFYPDGTLDCPVCGDTVV